jgi:hypothetical protein
MNILRTLMGKLSNIPQHIADISRNTEMLRVHEKKCWKWKTDRHKECLWCTNLLSQATTGQSREKKQGAWSCISRDFTDWNTKKKKKVRKNGMGNPITGKTAKGVTYRQWECQNWKKKKVRNI